MPQDQPRFEITEDFPTPIVRDFDLFVDAVGQPSASVTKGRRALDRTTLCALNSQMRTFQSETHPRMNQRDYPLLHLFQTICLAARLHVAWPRKGKLRMVPTERLAEFRALRPAERYLALLEAFWVDCPWEEYPFSGSLGLDSFQTLLGAIARAALGRVLDLPSLVDRSEFGPVWELGDTVRALSYFGFLDYTLDPKPKGYSFLKGKVIIQTIATTPLGRGFLRVLAKERPLGLWNLPIWKKAQQRPARFPGQSAEKGDGGVRKPTPFHAAFLPLLAPGCVAAGLSRRPRELKDQTYVFRVSYYTAWRTIALSSEHTLEDLHLAIQEAYRFDNDHLYAFYMDGKRGSSHVFMDPRADNAYPYADEDPIGWLDLYVGQRILYFFDFGDSWQFDVKLLETRDEPHRGRPKILQTEGESPKQYISSDW